MSHEKRGTLYGASQGPNVTCALKNRAGLLAPLGAAPTAMVMGVATITNRAPPANTGLSNGNRLLIATPRSIEPWISPTEPAIAPAEMTDSEVANQALRCRCTPVEPSRSPLGK
jgi:hypothetical protein